MPPTLQRSFMLHSLLLFCLLISIAGSFLPQDKTNTPVHINPNKPYFPGEKTWFKRVLIKNGVNYTANGHKCMLPRLTKVRTIVNLPDAHLRDPSSPIFDAGLWHFWATHMWVKDGPVGRLGRVYHYYAANLEGPWNSSGVAIDVAKKIDEFDHAGTFTPSSFRVNRTGEWIIFYSGVSFNASTRYRIGMATSTSPFGPWAKSRFNPVFTEEELPWCAETSTGARVDEAEPYLFQGHYVLLVKGCCANFTALPMLFASSNHSTKSPFQPPFKPAFPTPLFQASGTAKRLGFEQARIYKGKDGCVHLTGHDHGDSSMPHYIQTNTNDAGSRPAWTRAGSVATGQEFTPVWPKGSIPGDTAVPTHFLRFQGNPMHIDLMKVDWVQPRGHKPAGYQPQDIFQAEA